MVMYLLMVKFTASMDVNSMLKCDEFNLTDISEIIVQLQDSRFHIDTCRMHLPF